MPASVCMRCGDMFDVPARKGAGRPRTLCHRPECYNRWKRARWADLPEEQKERHLERMRANTARARQTKTGATTVFSPPFLASTR